MTEVLHPADKKGEDPLFDAPKVEELCGLLDKGTFRVVCREDLDNEANVLGGRFVLAIKNTETDQPTYKYRFVVQGHMDKDKDLIVNNSNTIRKNSIRMLIAIVVVFGTRIWSQEVSQAYLPAGEKLMRKVYLRAPVEFQLESNQLLQLLKPLYGLTDAGDYWCHTFTKHIRKDLKMIPTTGDLSLFTRVIGERLAGVTGAYVNDTLSAGTEEFDRESKRTEAKLKSSPRS